MPSYDCAVCRQASPRLLTFHSMHASAPAPCFPARRLMSDQRLANTLWVVVPSLMAVLMHARGGSVQVVARGLPAAPVALATDRRPASAEGFMWETRSTARERQFRARDGHTVRVTVRPGEMLLW